MILQRRDNLDRLLVLSYTEFVRQPVRATTAVSRTGAQGKTTSPLPGGLGGHGIYMLGTAGGDLPRPAPMANDAKLADGRANNESRVDRAGSAPGLPGPRQGGHGRPGAIRPSPVDPTPGRGW
jgi:hypothetical protein